MQSRCLRAARARNKADRLGELITDPVFDGNRRTLRRQASEPMIRDAARQ